VGALWLADVMGRMIRHRPEMLAYWLLKNNNAGHGLMSSYDLRPSYSVFQIYKQFGNHLLAANSDEAMVSVFAARKDDGSVTVIFVNRGEAAVKKPFMLENGDALKLAEVYLFDKDHKAEAVTLPAFKNRDQVELAGRSVTLFIFKP
jgi:O-glycosyl hydrolase